ncbi:MAG: YdjY domain-containing protein [Planctomycetota bacterium]
MLLIGLIVLLALSFPSGRAGPRQDPPPPTTIKPPSEEVAPLPVPEGAPEQINELILELAREGVTVDFEHRVVEVRGVILLDRMLASYPIEYLIVTETGFTHEALALVRVTPSRLNAAFLALGLTPGKTIEYVKKDPPPSEEDLISGKVREFDAIPPKGEVVDVSVRWTDEEGPQLRPIEDLIRYVTNGSSLPRRGFVYVGSKFRKVLIGVERQERFIADMEGNVVSLYLSGFGHCLFDMNSAEGAESYLYDIDTETCPAHGTKATFIFSLR